VRPTQSSGHACVISLSSLFPSLAVVVFLAIKCRCVHLETQQLLRVFFSLPAANRCRDLRALLEEVQLRRAAAADRSAALREALNVASPPPFLPPLAVRVRFHIIRNARIENVGKISVMHGF